MYMNASVSKYILDAADLHPTKENTDACKALSTLI